MTTAINDEVLALFRDEISGYLDSNWKEVHLELDSDLFEYPRDDLQDAIEKYQLRFNVNLECMDWSAYFPWEHTPLFARWFKLRR